VTGSAGGLAGSSGPRPRGGVGLASPPARPPSRGGATRSPQGTHRGGGGRHGRADSDTRAGCARGPEPPPAPGKPRSFAWQAQDVWTRERSAGNSEQGPAGRRPQDRLRVAGRHRPGEGRGHAPGSRAARALEAAASLRGLSGYRAGRDPAGSRRRSGRRTLRKCWAHTASRTRGGRSSRGGAAARKARPARPRGGIRPDRPADPRPAHTSVRPPPRAPGAQGDGGPSRRVPFRFRGRPPGTGAGEAPREGGRDGGPSGRPGVLRRPGAGPGSGGRGVPVAFRPCPLGRHPGGQLLRGLGAVRGGALGLPCALRPIRAATMPLGWRRTL
jgi:hypothetical protein